MAKTVVATAPDGSRKVFKNIQAAAAFLQESVEPEATVTKYRNMLASLFKNQREMAGYTWSKDTGAVEELENTENNFEDGEEVNDVEEVVVLSEEVQVGETDGLRGENNGSSDHMTRHFQNPESESFFELVDSIFQGDRVRLCVINDVKMVSAYDVIAIIAESSEHRKIFQRLCEAYPEVMTFVYMYQFQGQGQRPTPVVDAEGFHVIAMLSPGRRAGLFRVKSAGVLKNVLEGNFDELRQGSVPAYHEAVGHSNQLYRLARPAATRHDGQTLANFAGPCVYILTIRVGEKDMLKVGRSDDFNTRLAQHDKVFDVQEVYSITPCEKNFKLERAVKDRLRNYNHPVEINGKRYTELYLGLTPEDADGVVQECAKELETGDDRAFKLRMKELDRELAITASNRDMAEIEKMKLSIEKMKLRIEMFKLGMTDSAR